MRYQIPQSGYVFDFETRTLVQPGRTILAGHAGHV
jgi:hypothetical protein